MPTISHSELAPDEAVCYSLGMASFKLDGRTKSYETDDPAVIANSVAHPWLKVEYPEAPEVEGTFTDQIDPKDDPLSGVNSIANDPAEIAKARSDADEPAPVAIQSGLDQGDAVTVGDTAVTVAAVEDEAPKRRSTTSKKES